MYKLNIVDIFCGGGGESTGLIEAAHDYNFDVNMSAINHWERAIGKDGKKHIVRNHIFRPVKVLEVEGEYQEYEEKIQNVERKTEVPIYFHYFPLIR